MTNNIKNIKKTTAEKYKIPQESIIFRQDLEKNFNKSLNLLKKYDYIIIIENNKPDLVLMNLDYYEKIFKKKE